jgi:hypothetical protein
MVSKVSALENPVQHCTSGNLLASILIIEAKNIQCVGFGDHHGRRVMKPFSRILQVWCVLLGSIDLI